MSERRTHPDTLRKLDEFEKRKADALNSFEKAAEELFRQIHRHIGEIRRGLVSSSTAC